MKLDCGPRVLGSLRHLAKSAPHNLKREEPQFDFTMLSVWLGREMASELISALNETRLELVPRHAEDNSLMNAFWEELVCEVDANPQAYLDVPQQLPNLVEKFGEAWKKPLHEFEVFCSIENMKIGEIPIAIHGVEFFSPNDVMVAERSLPKPEIARWLEKEHSETLSVVTVKAASGGTAINVAKDRVTNALRLLQVSALCGVPRSTFFDDLYLWKLSGFFLSRSTAAENSQIWHRGFRRQFGPSVFNLGNDILEGIRNLELEHLVDLPEDIRDRILRSIYWISNSVLHELDDHKLVDLCTAMEILLIPEERSESSKGNTIALRYNLLRGNIIDLSVKWLYDCRNKVVHGGPLPVVGPREIWEMRLACYTTIASIVRSSTNMPDIARLRDLISTFESQERLTNFIRISGFATSEDEIMPKLVEEAKKKLKRLDSQDG